ncbi:SGF29 tudor-like domain [Zea mays]|nr:SGF29 tudor-like domain [Zea mays]
MLWLNW